MPLPPYYLVVILTGGMACCYDDVWGGFLKVLPSQGGAQAVKALNLRLATFLLRQVALFTRQLGSILPGRHHISCTPTSSRNSPPQRGENIVEDPRLKWVINLSN